MNIERIVSSSERGFVERSVDYIESCMNTHHAQTTPTAGCFVLGVSGPNGRVRRERALDTFTELAARENIAWERVRVFLVDERYGELPTEEDSNAHLMRRSNSKVWSACMKPPHMACAASARRPQHSMPGASFLLSLRHYSTCTCI